MDEKDKNELRSRAQNLLEERQLEEYHGTEAEGRALIHELRVHQIELELQNDELKETQKRLRTTRDHYLDLYNNAPVGYLTLDENGMVVQHNETLHQMFGSEEGSLRGTYFADLLLDEDGGIFRSRFRAFFKRPSNKHMVVRVAHPKSGNLYFRLQAREGLSSPADHKVDTDKALHVAVTDVTEATESNHALKKALDEAWTHQKETETLLRGARALMSAESFEVAAEDLFKACKEITGASAGYVALLTEDKTRNRILYLDPGGSECRVDPSLPMPIRGFRETAFNRKEPVFKNQFAESEHHRLLPKGHMTLENVLFVPLLIDGEVEGFIGLGNKPGGFTQRDLELGSAFGELAAVALREQHANDKQKELIQELQEAIHEVQTLSGMLPICAGCKKIRNDEGYWEQVEIYIQQRSKARFSHGLCPDCMEHYYGDLLEGEDTEDA